jgi:hypothetical protein
MRRRGAARRRAEGRRVGGPNGAGPPAGVGALGAGQCRGGRRARLRSMPRRRSYLTTGSAAAPPGWGRRHACTRAPRDVSVPLRAETARAPHGNRQFGKAGPAALTSGLVSARLRGSRRDAPRQPGPPPASPRGVGRSLTAGGRPSHIGGGVPPQPGDSALMPPAMSCTQPAPGRAVTGACSASTCSQDTHRERCRCSAPVSSGTSTALGPGLRRTGPRWVDDRPAAVAESVVVRTGHTPHVRIGAGGEPVEQAHAFEVGQPGDGSAACARRPRRRRRSQSPRGGRRGRGRPPPGSTAGPRSAGRRRCRPITAHATAAGGADRADRRPGAGPCRRADASAVVRADGGVHDTERTGLVPRPLAAGDVCRQADGHRQRSRRASARRGQSMHRQSRDTRA